MGKRVFIIHGRDVEARNELAQFLDALGLNVVRFESVASQLGGNPFVAEIVIEGLKQADAVIALFTPDEQAALYDSASGRSLADERDGSRWQARPNVIFEAGVAYGRSGKEPILAVLGADVSLFSDVGGMHFVQLDDPAAKRNLFDRLEALLGPLSPRVSDWEASSSLGRFAQVARRRWPWFDEVEVMRQYLENRHIGSGKSRISLMDVISGVVVANPSTDWSHLRPRDFSQAVRDEFGEARADASYWWFIVAGFYGFDNIDYWGADDDSTWEDSVDAARWMKRGLALLARLRCSRMLANNAMEPTARPKIVKSRGSSRRR